PADHRLVAPAEPGLYELRLAAPEGVELASAVRMVVLVPMSARQGTRLEGYFVGRYPTEGSGRTDAYAPPAGLIRVTPELADLRISTHFRLREFLTHDQSEAWPKFVLVDRQLLDKLELVMAELERSGIAAEHMVVMSGFRTPQYNRRGLDAGRASLSRHQWGDAADVWIDNDGDWYMDDLNRDGRRNTGDARVMLRAVERVEARYPELIGGAGIYDDNGAHGPFIHIDARGSRARW
ncbi:MAG: D-Ala-D-Ala carboxypeptidase family metallohydrolase, partial [Longimicrobiales bacterium]